MTRQTRFGEVYAACALAAILAVPAAADDCAYVASVTSGEVAVIDLADFHLAGAIPAVGQARDGISVDGAGHAYLLQEDPLSGAPIATVIDVAAQAVIARLPLPPCAYGRIRADVDRGRLFVAEACDDGLAVLHAGGGVLTEIAGCASVSDVVELPSARALAVAAPGCGGLHIVDLDTLATRVVGLSDEGAIAAVLGSGPVAYVITTDGAILRLRRNGEVDSRLLSLPASIEILDTAPSADPSVIYVLTGGGFDPGALYRVDLKARAAAPVALAQPVGSRDRLATGPAHARLLVTHYATGVVELVDGFQSVATVATARGITGAAVFSGDCSVPSGLAAEQPAARLEAATAPPPVTPAAVAEGTAASGEIDDWYVDCAAAESGDGSAEHPWKTIAEAAENVHGGGASGDGDGRGDVVHVRNGPCVVSNVVFGSRLSGPGPDCRTDDGACTVFRGEPEAISIIGGKSKSDGFLIQDGVDDLKLENFTFVGEVLSDPANAPFNEPVKISGGGTTYIVLKNVSVVSGALVHDSGIKVLGGAAHSILVEGGEVRGVAGVGYTLGGPSDDPMRAVTLRGTASRFNGGDGYVVSKDSRGVADAVFENTIAEFNAGDGYDVYAAFDAAPEQSTTFVGVTARGNGPPDCAEDSQGVGIKAWHSVSIANAVIEDNCQSGISLRRSTSSGGRDTSTAVASITASTLTNNARVGGAQITLDRARADYQVLGCTLASDQGKSAFGYGRRYACAAGPNAGDPCSADSDCLDSVCGAGGRVFWDQATLFRNDEGKLVSFTDRAGASRSCRNDVGEAQLCDVVGDCDFDFTVTADELRTAVGVALGESLPACAQIDSSGDQRATIDELVGAVNFHLGVTRQVVLEPPT